MWAIRRHVSIMQEPVHNIIVLIVGRDARYPESVAFEQQRRRPACASAQPDQHLCQSLHAKYDILTCLIHNFNILASLCC